MLALDQQHVCYLIFYPMMLWGPKVPPGPLTGFFSKVRVKLEYFLKDRGRMKSSVLEFTHEDRELLKLKADRLHSRDYLTHRQIVYFEANSLLAPVVQ